MSQYSYSRGGHLRRSLLLITSVVLLAGCGGESSNTAAFPDTGKKAIMTKEIPKTPMKGMDRVGSEAASP